MQAASANRESVFSKLLPSNLPKPLQSLLLRTTGLGQASEAYRAVASQDNSKPIAQRLIEYLNVSIQVSDVDLMRIPRKGPTLVVANHPCGILEGAVLATVLQRLRPDVRFLTNALLGSIPEIRDLVIPVDVLSTSAAGAANSSGLRRALEHLVADGMLVIFPAGEVSHFQWKRRGIADPAWSPTVARLLRCAAKLGHEPVVTPIYASGSNSLLFHLGGMIHPRIRTALLPRELINKQGATVELRIGAGVDFDKLRNLPSDTECIEYLRWRTDILEQRTPFKARTSLALNRVKTKPQAEIIDAEHAEMLATEVSALEPLTASGDLAVYLTQAFRIPHTLREISRLREITFRAAGEGTGLAADLDKFDKHYLHLFVWNTAKQEVVGAYRLSPTNGGPASLYTHKLFRFDQSFLDAMGPALELGRSFIRAEYQKGFAPLLLLWKGIGKFLAQNPQYKILFGPVSISNQYESLSRELMIAFLERTASLPEWMNLVNARRSPSRGKTDMRCESVEELSSVVSGLEPNAAGIPVLLRQYLRLGGKLVSFNVDPEFSNALDGLIVVDLTKTEPSLLDRYLGKQEAQSFLAFHQHRSE